MREILLHTDLFDRRRKWGSGGGGVASSTPSLCSGSLSPEDELSTSIRPHVSFFMQISPDQQPNICLLSAPIDTWASGWGLFCESRLQPQWGEANVVGVHRLYCILPPPSVCELFHAVRRLALCAVALNWCFLKAGEKNATSPPSPSDLSDSFPFPFRPVAFAKYPSLEEVEFISGQGFSEGTEEALIVGCVVDHEQDSSQQLIGYEQVVQVRPLVVPTAVATTPFHQGSEVILVPGETLKSSAFNGEWVLLLKGRAFAKLLPFIFEIHLKGRHLRLTVHHIVSVLLRLNWWIPLLLQF